MRAYHEKAGADHPALNDFRRVRAAVEELGYRHEVGTGWYQAVPKDRAAVAVAVVAHLGGDPTDMSLVKLIDGFLMDLAEGA